MGKNPEKSVAILVALALVGLISVQVYWAKRSYNLAEEAFNDKMVKILNVVRDDANESATCFTMYSKTYIDSGQGICLLKAGWHNKDSAEAWNVGERPDSIQMIFNAPEEYKNTSLAQPFSDLKFGHPITAEISLKFRYDMTKSSPNKKILSEKLSPENFRERMKNHEDLLSIYDTLMIDSLIRDQLKSNNMQINYAYMLVKSPSDSVEYSSVPAISGKILKEGIRTRLTPADLFSYPCDIVFYAENKQEYILKAVMNILSLSIGIIVLLLFAYWYFIRTILRQKKLSEMKNDFINNMTHEFNTPIANISLAYETLSEKGKISDDELSNRITEIIKTETIRLKENVTRILKISSFERNGIDISPEQTDIVAVINCAISRLELTIKKKNAVINVIKPAPSVFYSGDKLHLSSAIENLLDNALKYSNEDCRIDIEIINSDKGIFISVSDNGIGMSPKEIDKIFEKFYRVQKGNIQNDRGFGLGLNYVKYVVEAHGGNISVISSPGEGSCFKIYLNGNERKN